MDKIRNSDLVLISVWPKFRFLESWNDRIEYIDYGFWILIRVVERLKVFDALEKLFCIACKVIFLVFEVEVLTQVYSWLMLWELAWDQDKWAICICGFYCKSFQVILLASC